MPDTTETLATADNSFAADNDDFLLYSDRIALSLDEKAPGRASALGCLVEEAQRGEPGSQFYLGLRLYLEAEKDGRSEGLKWFKKAADKNLEEAIFCLGLIHREGDPELRDPGKSRRLIRKAAARGLREDAGNYSGFAWETNTDLLRAQELGYAVLRLRGAHKKYGH